MRGGRCGYGGGVGGGGCGGGGGAGGGKCGGGGGEYGGGCDDFNFWKYAVSISKNATTS